ncbi:hypothetical protein D7322_08400 [Sphingobacterium puteale]|uniref:Uncharacterized protein n=2 Tax=Sphingobacterium puteale TaxID=2420510 RepID=A0A420W0L1_9SPHI|nr:hypothetical protein D7322_08400 [Sphingobacterium puteale]
MVESINKENTLKEMKSLILISSFLILLWQNQKKEVYILKDAEGNVGIEYNKTNKDVNIIISDELVRNNSDRRAIKMYLASFFFIDNDDLKRDFRKLFNISMSGFAKNNKKQICKVIYYLEHIDHGNLPDIYGLEAYKLFEISDLKPEISTIEQCLNKGKILKIIHESEEDSLPLKTPKRIKK